MADTYSVKKITDLTTKTTTDDTDLYVLGNQGTATMRKITFANLAAKIRDKLTSLTFSALNTSNKTLPGAINELNSNMSGISIKADTLRDTAALTYAVPNNYRGILLFLDAAANRNGAYFLRAASTGAIYREAITEASGITFDTSEPNKLGLSIPTSGSVAVRLINIVNSVS